MTLVVTQIGLDKATQADLQGVSFKITHVAVGLNGYTPDNSMTALQNEVVRVGISGGKDINANQVHLTAMFDGEGEISGREIGFYLEDGTLFAIDSHPTDIILYKSATQGARALVGFDLVLDGVPPGSITVDITGDIVINFDNEFQQIDNQFLSLQFAPYDPLRTYKTGEVCTIEVSGEVQAMQMYAGPNLTCLDKDPADLANRHESWAGAPAPWWWIPYTGSTPGQMSGWLSDTVPEQAVLENEVDLNAQLYWRLAKAWPELVNAGVINTRDILGRYTRTADGVDYLVNTTHEDAIRNITGSLLTNWNIFDNYDSTGVFRNKPGDIERSITSSASESLGGDYDFDASRVVPTAAQNQPVTSVENKIVFI